MKSIKKNVYYCDFCKKRSLAAHAMITHETHCTANPDRVCRTCDGHDIKDTITKFKSRFTLHENPLPEWPFPDNYDPNSHRVEWIGEPITLNEIRNEVDGCPNCMLAILRQTGMNRHYFDFKFDYKGELADVMKEKNDDRRYASYH